VSGFAIEVVSGRTGAMYDPQHPNPDERYASDFAAALLMPEDAFRAAWADLRRSGARLVLIAYRFGVPVEAVRYRLVMLGLLDPRGGAR
jgi:Zn-dependent peptidase ImmA (M78 family)